MKTKLFASAHKATKALHVFAKCHGGWAQGKSYRELFAHFLAKEWVKMKEAAEPVEKFTISLQYSEVTLRDKVKSLGGKWNADRKVWTVSCKRHQLGVLENKIAATPVITKKPVYNTGFGYYGTARDAARGFDGIE